MTKNSSEPSDLFTPKVQLKGLLQAAGAVITVGGVLPGLATVAGFFGHLSWFLDLFSHFRVQYLISLSLIGLLLLIAKYFRAAAAYLGLAAVNLLVVQPLYFGGPTTPADEALVLRAMLINVNTGSGQPARVRTVVSAFDPDILVLEEISSRWLPMLEDLADTYPYSSKRPREDNFGIGFLSKLPILESEITYLSEALLPTILATVATGSAELHVIATHPLPPVGRDYSRWRNDQLAQLPALVPSATPTLLIGDLNTTPWSSHFQQLLKSSGLLDSARGFGFQPSWPDSGFIFQIPIDHCLHSEDIVIVNRQIGPDVASDHFPLIVDFAIRTSGFCCVSD